MLCYDKYEMLTTRMSIMANRKPLVFTSPKQRQGHYYEELACLFLQHKGLVLITQNWQQPKVGELDLVMLEVGQSWSTLVFVEVRQRQHSGFGDAALSVTQAKRRKVIKTAKYFLQQHPQYAHYDCRFDVIAYDIIQLPKDDVDQGKTNNQPVDYEPEWLIGAFIATAW